MVNILQVPILIEGSPNQLIPGREITEWTVQQNRKFKFQALKFYYQVGGRAFINGRICEQGYLKQSKTDQEVIAIDKLSFLSINVEMENQVAAKIT